MGGTLVSVVILTAFIVVSIVAIKAIVYSVRKAAFLKQYGITDLAKSIKIKKKKGYGPNYFELKYPYWAVSKKDGTADLRVKKNYIVWQKSTLYVDNYELTTKQPYELLGVVKEIRAQGVQIKLCREEKEKYFSIKKRKEIFVCDADIQKLVDYYSEKPTNFEGLCAKLFDNMGYISKVTPQTNDGGYDILLNKAEEKVIVECKCYSIKHKIGRPAIQKLVGANNIVSAKRMIFITTSDFTPAAISYAKEVGVELINGHTLLDILQKQGFMNESKTKVTMEEYQLNVSDLHLHVPSDIYVKYFRDY